MSSIDGSFTISVGGQLLAKPAEAEADDGRIHVSTGNDGAVFEFRDGRLQSGDWVINRFMIEDRSLLPKRVYWFRKDNPSGMSDLPIVAEKQGGKYNLTIGGSPLMIREDKLFVALIPEMGEDQTVQLNMQ